MTDPQTLALKLHNAAREEPNKDESYAWRLVQVVEGILDIHQPGMNIGDIQYCEADDLAWPCPTIDTIAEALKVQP